MMTVNFKKNWFAPGSPMQRPGEPRILSGRRFRKGLHKDVPEDLFPFLPKSAELVDRGNSEYTPEKAPAGAPKADLHAEDLDRAAGEQKDEVLKAAEESETARKRKAFNEELKKSSSKQKRADTA